MPDDLDPIGKTRDCTLYPDGIISFSQQVIDQVGWRVGQEIIVSNLRDLPLCLLFRPSDPDTKGYRLSYKNKGIAGGNGGKLTCRRIIREIVSPEIALPIRGVVPTYLAVDNKSGFKPYQMAFMLSEPAWTDIEFSAAGAESIPSHVNGVYQVMFNGNKVGRIGQGAIQDRIRENLRLTALRQCRRFYYFPMPLQKSDSLLLEHILLQRHKQQNDGKLPPGNHITA